MSENIVWHHHPVDQSVRAEMKDQNPADKMVNEMGESRLCRV